MSLGALRGVDPYLKEAMGWLTWVAESWGGGVSFFSGRRTRADQQELWDFCKAREPSITRFPSVPCPFPVATPGCSQHEYGFAVDAGFFSPRNRLGISESWNGYFQGLAKEYWGLSTVANDPNHFAMYPSSDFLPWARATGQCPTNPPVLSLKEQSTIYRICGGGNSVSCNFRTGCQCGQPVWDI